MMVVTASLVVGVCFLGDRCGRIEFCVGDHRRQSVVDLAALPRLAKAFGARFSLGEIAFRENAPTPFRSVSKGAEASITHITTSPSLLNSPISETPFSG
jgi:hypothetical protein